MEEVNSLVEGGVWKPQQVPLNADGTAQQEMVCDVSIDGADNVSLLSSEEGEAQPIILSEDHSSSAAATAASANNNSSTAATNSNRKRRFWRRRQRGSAARIGAPSWWTELRNIETNGCTFALAYICLSFVLMTLMFNMREIVGDYCLGNKEIMEAEYRANVEKAMQIRRRSPFSVDQEDRFEKELQAELYYDREGQLGDDTDYLRHHRVPIIRSEDKGEEEDDSRAETPLP
jgi:hypothetical protein